MRRSALLLARVAAVGAARKYGRVAVRSLTTSSAFHAHRAVFPTTMATTVRRFSSGLPRHEKLQMPALSPTMKEGNINKWLVKEGDKVAPGDALCEIQTDKASLPWESQEDGYVAKILVPDETSDIPVGQVVLIIVENAEDVKAFASFKADAPPAKKEETPKEEPKKQEQQQQQQPPQQQQQQTQQHQQQQSASHDGRVVASPLARSVAAASGVQLSHVRGTGPRGRIIAADVREAGASASAGAGAGDYSDIAVNNIRKVIAQRLLEAKTTIPHYYLTIECEMDSILKLKKEFAAKDIKLSVNDFIVKAAAVALRQVPEVNSSWMGTHIRKYNYVDVSVAVATDNGLITPIVSDADIRGLKSINEKVKELAEKARAGKLAPHEFQGGTFTISNLGMYGVTHFSAIINPPQAAIMAVGSLNRVMKPDDKGNAVAVTTVNVTLSCDHRVVDGAVGARYLQHFKELIETPTLILAY